MFAVLASLTGCVAHSSTPDTAHTSAPKQATATVERRTITDVLTVSFTVTAGVDYTVSAPAIGKLEAAGAGYAFLPSSGGPASPLSLPATTTHVEALVPEDTEIAAGTPLLSVHDAALTLKAPLTAAQVLRLAGRIPSAVKAEIDGSTGPFDCPLDDPRPTESEDGDYAVYCRLPVNVPAIDGATGLIALTLSQAKDALALPIEAVAGSRQDGEVYLKGHTAPHPVSLGITDGAYIQITKGLNAGDVVTIPSPSLLGDD